MNDQDMRENEEQENREVADAPVAEETPAMPESSAAPEEDSSVMTTPGPVADTDESEQEDESLRDLRISRMSGHSKKKKSIVNGVDLLIIVVAIALAVCFATQFNPFGFLKGKGNETTVLEYEILISDVDDTFSRNIQEGDRVRGAGANNDMGTVSGSVIVDDFTQLVYVDGKAELTPYGNRVNLTVKIRVENAAYVSGTGYTVNGTRVAVGSELQLVFPTFSATGTVVNINRVA